MLNPGRYQIVIELIDEIMGSSAPADTIMTKAFRQKRYIGSSDRRFICDITYDLLRQYYGLKWTCGIFGFAPNGRSFVLIELCKKLSILQINEIFSGDDYAPAYLTPREMEKIGRLMQGSEESHPISVQLNVPEWLLPQLKESFEENLTQEVQALNEAATLDLRVNSLKTTRSLVLTELEKEGIPASPTPYSPVGVRLSGRRPLGDHELWKKGFIEVQDEGSQLVGLLVQAEPGMSVMDFCAGAGGKTLTMATTMMNKGRLVACDVVEWRLNRARERFRRGGVHNVENRLLDDTSSKWLKRQTKKFDRVLIDVPCSGTGTWRRNPDLKWRLTQQSVDEIIEKQRFILKQAALLVKPTGWLIYATCSLLKTENEDQIKLFLDENPDFECLPVSTILEKIMKKEWPNQDLFLRLSPFQHKTDGFFAAILRRKEENLLS